MVLYLNLLNLLPMQCHLVNVNEIQNDDDHDDDDGKFTVSVKIDALALYVLINSQYSFQDNETIRG